MYFEFCLSSMVSWDADAKAILDLVLSTDQKIDGKLKELTLQVRK